MKKKLQLLDHHDGEGDDVLEGDDECQPRGQDVPVSLLEGVLPLRVARRPPEVVVVAQPVRRRLRPGLFLDAFSANR